MASKASIKSVEKPAVIVTELEKLEKQTPGQELSKLDKESQKELKNIETNSKVSQTKAEEKTSERKMKTNEKLIKEVSRKISKENFIKYYHLMLLIRRFEERAGQAYGMGLIGGFCHLYIGQEAIIAGVKAALRENDALVTSYRDHGHILASGTDPKLVMAELFGKETGISRGKGGSMHLFDLERRFFGGHGIVAAQVPIGAGVAFAYKYLGEESISVTFFGDGAANQGQVYEAFNIASLWKLPVIFIVENNEYGMGTSVKRSTATAEFYKRGEAFGIEGRQVNGMDFFIVREEMQKAADSVRSGNGPILLEMKTYRYRGHSMSDPGNYRSKEEINEYKENHDPIENFKKFALRENLVSEAEIKGIELQVKGEVEQSLEFAKNSKEPIASELWTDIYC